MRKESKERDEWMTIKVEIEGMGDSRRDRKEIKVTSGGDMVRSKEDPWMNVTLVADEWMT